MNDSGSNFCFRAGVPGCSGGSMTTSKSAEEMRRSRCLRERLELPLRCIPNALGTDDLSDPLRQRLLQNLLWQAVLQDCAPIKDCAVVAERGRFCQIMGDNHRRHAPHV